MTMKKRRVFPALLLCMALLLPLTAPSALAISSADIAVDADAQTITVAEGAELTIDDLLAVDGYDTAYMVINYGRITGGSAELPNSIENYGDIDGGRFTGEVVNIGQSTPLFSGRITGGVFTGTVHNRGESISYLPYITGGTFTGYIKNSGYIIGGVFEETSEVYNYFVGLKEGTFKGTVRTERYPINGGTYSGNVIIEHLGSITNGTFTEAATVTQKTVWATISGGTFDCEIHNIAIVNGGTFNATFTNSGTVAYGIFNADVLNEASGTMYSDSRAKTTLLNGHVTNYGLIYGCDFGPDATVTDEGELYVLATVFQPVGINPVFVGKFFRYGENVREALARYDEEGDLHSSWLRTPPGAYTLGVNRIVPAVEIEEDRTFSLQLSENRFVRTPIVETKHTEHIWDYILFSWSQDCTVVTATFICHVEQEDHMVNLAASVSSADLREPTCTENGGAVYTATVELAGETYTDTQTVSNVPATGHAYGDAVFAWSEDGKTAEATFTCGNDPSHVEAVETDMTHTVKTPATCTEKGFTTYTATVNFGGKTYTATHDVEDIPATGHDYQDGVCTRCGEKDLSVLLGDVNGDGRINAADYLLLKRYVLGTYGFTEKQKAVADVKRDGQINAVDYLLLKRYVLGTYKIA